MDHNKRGKAVECYIILKTALDIYRSKAFDIFLSHALVDKPFVLPIYRLYLCFVINPFFSSFLKSFAHCFCFCLFFSLSCLLFASLNAYFFSFYLCFILWFFIP